MAVGYLNDAVQGNSNDALTVIFASDGSYISHSVYGGVGRDEYRDIVKAPDGTLVAVGQVQSLMSDGFGTTYGDTDALISKFHATSGAPLWHKSYGGAGKDFLDGVTVDSTGKIFVSGHTYSSNSGVFSTPIAGKNDAVIMSLDSDGSLNWVENFAGANAEHFYKLSTTTDGNIIGVGYTGSTSINGEVIPQNGDFDAFAAKVNANTGETIWLKN